MKNPKEEPKQESLEEAAERFIPDNYIKVAPKQKVNAAEITRHYFREGAEWLAERMIAFINDEDNHTEGELGNSCIDVQSLVSFVKQFKKK